MPEASASQAGMPRSVVREQDDDATREIDLVCRLQTCIARNLVAASSAGHAVHWGGPYGTINAAAGHHITEGRWIRDPTPMDSNIKVHDARGLQPPAFDLLKPYCDPMARGQQCASHCAEGRACGGPNNSATDLTAPRVSCAVLAAPPSSG